MRIICLHFYLLFTITVVNAQQLSIRGQVLSKIDSSHVSYATIEVMNQRKGVASDGMGQFLLTLDSVSTHDSLLIRALGFDDLQIAANDLLHTDSNRLNFFVAPRTYQLNEITIVPTHQTKGKIKGIAKTAYDGNYYAHSFNKVALYIDNNNNRTGTIKSVSFFIHKHGKHKAPFRIRIYKMGPSGRPGEDLLSETVLGQAKKKKSWVNINLEEYAIAIPKDGFFVCMEWVYTSDKYYYKKTLPRNLGTYQLYGATLANTPAPLDQGRTWTTYLGNTWRKERETNYKGKPFTFNALINAELVYHD